MSEGGRGNGVDLGAIYGAIMALSAELKAVRAEMATKADIAAVRAELATKADKADVAAVRSEVATYHASVVGHGVLISEHEDRIGRLERGEPPPKAA